MLYAAEKAAAQSEYGALELTSSSSPPLGWSNTTRTSITESSCRTYDADQNEHHRPYCHHCRDFAPTWHDLVETLGPASEPKGFHFAQVDCAANGDLCKAHGVKYYPSLFLYVGGELYDEYEGKRTLEALTAYVDGNMPGKVVWVDDDDDAPVAIAPSTTSAPATSVAPPTKPKGKNRMELKVVGEGAKEPTALELLMGTVASADAPSVVPSHTSISLTPLSEPEPTPAAPRPAFRAQLFVEEQKREAPSDAPDGTVHVLEADEVAAVKAKGAGPAFVKYFAPWCVVVARDRGSLALHVLMSPSSR